MSVPGTAQPPRDDHGLEWSHHRAASAAARVDDAAAWRWERDLDELFVQVGKRFARVEPRPHARDMVRGMLAGLPRANCWTLAEHVGHERPDALQHLLAGAAWNEDGVRDDLRSYVVRHLAGPDPAGDVLVVDETGDLKKDTGTVGVQRQ